METRSADLNFGRISFWYLLFQVFEVYGQTEATAPVTSQVPGDVTDGKFIDTNKQIFGNRPQ